MRALAILLAIVLGSASSSAAEEARFVLIVNAKNPVTRLDKKTVADAFLKKRTRWSDDKAIQPVDHSKTSNTRKLFSSMVLERSIASVRTYWNQLVFSGRGVPPPEVESDDEVVRFIAGRPGAIGYVATSTKLVGVKVVEIN